MGKVKKIPVRCGTTFAEEEMKTVTFNLPRAMHERMRAARVGGVMVNWSAVAREAFGAALARIEAPARKGKR